MNIKTCLHLIWMCALCLPPAYAGGSKKGKFISGPSYTYGHIGGYWRNYYSSNPWSVCPPNAWFGYPIYYDYPLRNRPIDAGAIDLNVTPKKTEVYIDGEHQGKVRRFDGFPDYLWLPEGRHELVFFLDGYETFRKEIEIVAGYTLRAEHNMIPGNAKPVSEISTFKAEQEAQRAELLARYGKDRPHNGPRQPASQPTQPPTTTDQGQLTLSLNPTDAAVYLDGAYLGTGADLSKNQPVPIAPGSHVLEVVRPGYASQRNPFEVTVEKPIHLTVTLQADPAP